MNQWQNDYSSEICIIVSPPQDLKLRQVIFPRICGRRFVPQPQLSQRQYSRLCSVSVDLTSDETSAAGGRRRFARIPDHKQRARSIAITKISERQEQVVQFPVRTDQRDLADQEFRGRVIPDRDHPPVRRGEIPHLHPGMERLAADRHIQREYLARIVRQGKDSI